MVHCFPELFISQHVFWVWPSKSFFPNYHQKWNANFVIVLSIPLSSFPAYALLLVDEISIHINRLNMTSTNDIVALLTLLFSRARTIPSSILLTDLLFQLPILQVYHLKLLCIYCLFVLLHLLRCLPIFTFGKKSILVKAL